ncbi:MAG TPA: FAD binding domain-containing protein [Gaiellaceae bacterium]|nr:FAD binding domain-containing protein [Gaiellaceae bacterium]
MKPPPFSYRRAASLGEAAEWLADLGGEAKVLAGGQSLVPMLSFRLARPSALVDVSRVPDACDLRHEEGRLRIGALATHRQLEHAPLEELPGGFALLPRAARLVGHPPIRLRGTFGGSIAHADPAAEWCVLATLFDAEIVALSRAGVRTIPVAEFFRGFFATALRPDEVLAEVVLRHGGREAALVEFARRHGDFALVAAAASLDGTPERVVEPRVVVGGVHDVPFRSAAAEAALAGAALTPEAIAAAAAAAAAEVEPASDVHADAAHRRQLTGTLVRRALEEVRSRWRP